MTHVASKALELHLRVLEETGTPLDRFLEGTSLTTADVHGGRRRIPWDIFAELNERLERLTGGARALENAGARLLEGPSLRGVATIAALFAHPRSFYWAAHKWAGASLFSVIETDFAILGPTRVRLSVSIPEPYRVSPAFFHLTAGTFRAAPKILGLPESIVTSEVDGRRCDYIIDHPPSMTLWARLRHAVIVVFSARRAFSELRAQNDELRLRLEEISRARAEAEDLSRLKSEFIANVSHEIRTPLNGVIGLSDILLGSTLGREDRIRATMIRTSAGVLLRVLDDVLDFSRLESGKLELDHRDYDLRELLGRVEDTFATEITAKGLSFEIDVAPGLPRRLFGDDDRLEQLLFNLVDNAVKFTPRGTVHLRALPEQGIDGVERLRFEVEDTGPGIPETTQQALFTPFLQADGKLTREHGGTGLGLAIARELVTLMQGQIGVNSTPGVGSTFWLTVPLVAAKSASRPDSQGPRTTQRRTPSLRVVSTSGILETSAPSTAPAEHRLLVVEDNPVNRMVIVRHLEKLGYRVDTAENGREAVEISAARPYAAILMDIQMPEMDGFRATTLIRMREGSGELTPIVAVTAHSEPEFVARAREVGMNDLLPKPVTRARLEEVLQRVLAARTGDCPKEQPLSEVPHP